MEQEAPETTPEEDLQRISSGLSRIRKRRWMLWCVLIIYLPGMMTAQEVTGSFQGALPYFFAWFVLLLIFAGVSATATCPRCGKYFHVNGMTLLYLRKCLHCQLHLTADRKASHKSAL